MCSVKLDDNLKKDLEKAVKKSGKTKSQIIRESLKKYLANIKDLSIIKDKSKNKKIKKDGKELKEDDFEEFEFAIEALKELKDGNYTQAEKKINKVIKDLKK